MPGAPFHALLKVRSKQQAGKIEYRQSGRKRAALKAKNNSSSTYARNRHSAERKTDTIISPIPNDCAITVAAWSRVSHCPAG
jgi:hypothetical protein